MAKSADVKVEHAVGYRGREVGTDRAAGLLGQTGHALGRGVEVVEGEIDNVHTIGAV
ncbi:hypothetical protein GO988_00400 [Hymenobacter sp. HMF4947]|uniref:Uncharacterized protein n=1 Tax=Hymenobacter ginkgonis TaxID=2682976 RepID=A0A7K1T8P4_9BACT|nr:hypothetical protein [Hymenobacter ginkgonis]MVN74779.1 hypothetical protein [Hymenobacter ginkgonis]